MDIWGIHGRYTGDIREIHGRYMGIYRRYTGDIREIYGRYRGALSCVRGLERGRGAPLPLLLLRPLLLLPPPLLRMLGLR